MSPSRQEELTHLLQKVLALQSIRELEPDARLLRVHYQWLEAGDATQRTVARLSEQLRRYLDDQAWLENRRIMTILRDIEQHALALRRQSPPELCSMDDLAPRIELAMERPLFRIPIKPTIQQHILHEGDGAVDTQALYNQVYVDKARLQARIRKALQHRTQISLGELLDNNLLSQGLAELVTYLSIAAEDAHALIDDSSSQVLHWTDEDGQNKAANVPLVIFSRGALKVDHERPSSS